MSLKVGTGERFVCKKCFKDHPYSLRDRLIPMKPGHTTVDPEDRRFWALFCERHDEILYVTLDKDPTLAYNRHLSYIVKLADRLHDAGIYIGRVHIENDMTKQYPEANIKLGGSSRKTMVWQRYDFNRKIPCGMKFKRDYGHGWLGNIEVV